MTALALEIEKKANKLPLIERERLAERLLARLRLTRLTVVEDAWVVEAERRFDAWKRGQTKARPAASVVAQVRKELKRASRS